MLFDHVAQSEPDALQSISIATYCCLFLITFFVSKYFVVSAAISW